MELDLKEYGLIGPDFDPAKSTVYELYAVALHLGGVYGGHLVTTTKNPLNGKWYHLDDPNVEEVPVDHRFVQGEKAEKAIIVCYRRKQVQNHRLLNEMKNDY